MQQIGADCEKTDFTQRHEAKEGHRTAGKGIFRPSSYSFRLFPGFFIRSRRQRRKLDCNVLVAGAGPFCRRD